MSGCQQEACTVAETGVCLLNHEVGNCPFRLKDQAEAEAISIPEIDPPLAEPERNPSFPLGLTLTPELARGLMAKRYCHVVGIIGAPDAGKTASLVSIYLLLARKQFEGYAFADSRTLVAFDEISRGARRWNEGQLPDQLTVHTELPDDRTAGFLHLRLIDQGNGQPVDLLLPDLPGEWSTEMIDSARVDRLQFLKGADVVWLMVDGVQLSEPSTRQWALHRAKLLIQRLASFATPTPPVILVVTRRDQGEPHQGSIDSIVAEALARGVNLKVISVASFADPGGPVQPGHGIAELIRESTLPPVAQPSFWPEDNGVDSAKRYMMRYRNGG